MANLTHTNEEKKYMLYILITVGYHYEIQGGGEKHMGEINCTFEAGDGYIELLFPCQDVAEISLKRRKSSKQPTKRCGCGNSFNSMTSTRTCMGHHLVLKIRILSETSILYLIRFASIILIVGLHR